MSRRHSSRAMNPHAFDPFEHNRIVARRRAYRRHALAVVAMTRQLRAFNRSLVSAAAAMGVAVQPWQAKQLYATPADLAALRRTYLGDEDDE